MEENNKKDNIVEQPSVEQLKYWLDKAIDDNKQLVSKLRDVTDALNILPYLFKVIELKEEFGTEITDKARTIISNIMFPAQETEKEESKEDK